MEGDERHSSTRHRPGRLRPACSDGRPSGRVTVDCGHRVERRHLPALPGQEFAPGGELHGWTPLRADLRRRPVRDRLAPLAAAFAGHRAPGDDPGGAWVEDVDDEVRLHPGLSMRLGVLPDGRWALLGACRPGARYALEVF